MKTINIAQLYPKDMNIYGDTGNVLVLRRRLEWRGFEANVRQINTDDSKLDLTDVDIIIGGGGQDSGQLNVENHLQLHKKEIKSASEDGVAMLMICGMYQLFGHEFVTLSGAHIKGISVFDLVTVGSDTRMIGNVVINTSLGEIVGFENHSGRTVLKNNQSYFGKVVKGSGNNGEDGYEGAELNNTFGTYLHGPLLPKNPVLADRLILRALSRKYGLNDIQPLDDFDENRAHKWASGLLY